MERFVSLEKLPDDFVIPEAFADRLSFDPASRRLGFRGHMTKSDYDRLGGLTRDWAFRRHLEELFRQCVYNGRPKSEPRAGLLAALRRRIAPD